MNSGDDKSKTKRGGKRPGAGRKKGQRDVATMEQRGTLSELAREHTTTALNTLVRVAKNSDSDAAAVSAAAAILDRGYGRPAQTMEVSGPNGGPVTYEKIERVIVDPAEQSNAG